MSAERSAATQSRIYAIRLRAGVQEISGRDECGVAEKRHRGGRHARARGRSGAVCGCEYGGDGGRGRSRGIELSRAAGKSGAAARREGSGGRAFARGNAADAARGGFRWAAFAGELRELLYCE